MALVEDAYGKEKVFPKRTPATPAQVKPAPAAQSKPKPARTPSVVPHSGGSSNTHTAQHAGGSSGAHTTQRTHVASAFDALRARLRDTEDFFRKPKRDPNPRRNPIPLLPGRTIEPPTDPMFRSGDTLPKWSRPGISRRIEQRTNDLFEEIDAIWNDSGISRRIEQRTNDLFEEIDAMRKRMQEPEPELEPYRDPESEPEPELNPAQQAQIAALNRLLGTRRWSGSGGKLPSAKAPEGIDGEIGALYNLLYKLPANFPVEDWDNLPARAQLARIQRTDLTREEQWTLLNKDGIVSTLGKIQNLQLHQPEYGLSTMALNRASKSLMDIAVARWEAKSADSPFEDPKQRNRFLRMLDERENAVLENARGGGQAPLTDVQFLGYDKQGARNGEPDYTITIRDNGEPEIIVIPGKPSAPTPVPMPAPTPTPDNRLLFEAELERLAQPEPENTPIPYTYGGKNPESGGLDCSGFIQQALVESGIPLVQALNEEKSFSKKSFSSRGLHSILTNKEKGYGSEIWDATKGTIQSQDLQPGDILFFTDTKDSTRITHVAYYAGTDANGNMIIMESSSKAGKVIQQEIAFDKNNKRESTGQYLYSAVRPNYQYSDEG